MSVLNMPLQKALRLFYAPPPLRRRILSADIRSDKNKADKSDQGSGGDFHVPFWSDVKKHISGDGDLVELTDIRIRDNNRRSRLYPLLRDGVLDLLSAKLRWSNEPIEIVAQSVHGHLELEGLGGKIRVLNAFHARVRNEYTRIVYPYFSAEPALSDEGGRLGIWAMQKALPEFEPSDMRIIDPLRRKFFSPQITPLLGDEEKVFRKYYEDLIVDWERLKRG